MSKELDVIEIDAALEDAMNMPFENLLLIEEFIEKLGGIERAKLAIETLSEIQDAA